jgi:hypothetical protein
MMAANVNLQVWLTTVPDTRPAVVIPYVRSPRDSRLRYRVNVSKRGPGGSSTIGQGGDVQARADQPTPLSQFSVDVGARDQCHIEITLLADGQPAGTYHFDCPR